MRCLLRKRFSKEDNILIIEKAFRGDLLTQKYNQGSVVHEVFISSSITF